MFQTFFYFFLFFSFLLFLADSKYLNINRAPREVLFGNCYDFELPADFQPDRFVSEKRWYELGRYRNDVEKDADCVYIAGNINDDGNWALAFNLRFPNETLDTQFITVRPTNDSKYEAKFEDDSTWSSFTILDTDYDHYGIIYSCWQKPHEPIPTKQERLWVLSRDRSISTDIEGKINGSLHITQDNIDLSIYIYEINQETCS